MGIHGVDEPINMCDIGLPRLFGIHTTSRVLWDCPACGVNVCLNTWDMWNRGEVTH